MMKKKLTLRQRRAIVGLLFILPWLIGFIVYYVQGISLSVRYSLSELNFLETGGFEIIFKGFDNYIYAFRQHASYTQALSDSVQGIIIDVPFIIFFSLFMAMLLNSKFKGRTLVRLIFFLPILFGSGAVLEALQRAQETARSGAALTTEEVSASAGIFIGNIVDIILDLGLPRIFIDYIYNLLNGIYNIVRASSIQIIIFLASLQSISPALYEVSKIEGATPYETFWKVTLPMVSPLIVTNVVYTIVDGFAKSEVLDLAFTTSFRQYNYGLGAAMTLVSTIIVCVILVIVVQILNKKIFYYN